MGAAHEIETRREVVARAPLRISFAGGGTDVPPYPELHGGAAINATINRYAHCSVRAGISDKIRVTSLDLDQTREFAAKSIPEFDGNLDLITAVLRRINVEKLDPMEITLYCDAPPGSGLGASSAIVVALICALAKYLGVTISRHELGHLAYLVERKDVGISGGLQDQYASAYGGFNFMEFGRDVEVIPIRLEPCQVYELESRLVLAYVGETRLSSRIIEQQTDKFVRGDKDATVSLKRLRELAFETRAALLPEQYDLFASCVQEGWRHKRGLTESIVTDVVETVYALGLEVGALSGKLVGAGGGGYMLFVVSPELQRNVIEGLNRFGISVVEHLGLGSVGAIAWERRMNLARVHEAFGAVNGV